MYVSNHEDRNLVVVKRNKKRGKKRKRKPSTEKQKLWRGIVYLAVSKLKEANINDQKESNVYEGRET